MKITEPYSPTARANARAAPVSIAGASDGRTTRASVCSRVAPKRRRRLLDVEVEVLHHRLHRADDERQADEGERHDHAQRRERDLDPERIEKLPDPAVGRVDRGQRDAGHRGRQRERQVDDGVEQALEREIVAHQHPGDERAHDQVERSRPRTRHRS